MDAKNIQNPAKRNIKENKPKFKKTTKSERQLIKALHASKALTYTEISGLFSRSLNTIHSIIHDKSISIDESNNKIAEMLLDKRENLKINKILGHKADIVLNNYLDKCISGEVEKPQIIPIVAIKDKSFIQGQLIAGEATEITDRASLIREFKEMNKDKLIDVTPDKS